MGDSRDLSHLTENPAAQWSSRIILILQGAILIAIAALAHHHMAEPPMIPLMACYSIGGLFAGFALLAPGKWCIWLAGLFPWGV